MFIRIEFCWLEGKDSQKISRTRDWLNHFINIIDIKLNHFIQETLLVIWINIFKKMMLIMKIDWKQNLDVFQNIVE